MDSEVHDPVNESLTSRVIRPLVLLAPLTVLVLVGGVVYGRRSASAAAEIDATALSLVAESADGYRVQPDRICPSAPGSVAEQTFYRLYMEGEDRTSSLTGVGFDHGLIELRGWVDDPGAGADPANRRNIGIDVSRLDGSWCVTGLRVGGGTS